MATPHRVGKESSTKAAKEEQAKNRLSEIENDKANEQEFGETITLDEAPVLTAEGVPDMRFKENRNSFLFDRSKTISGRPDNRLKQNRPDIQRIHEKRGDDRPNVRFAGPGVMKEETEE